MKVLTKEHNKPAARKDCLAAKKFNNKPAAGVRQLSHDNEVQQ